MLTAAATLTPSHARLSEIGVVEELSPGEGMMG